MRNEAQPFAAAARAHASAKTVSFPRTLAYAASVPGLHFFYIPMWSILPALYGKYFGLSLTSIAAVVLFIRLFDGVLDTTIGYTSDWSRSKGVSSKLWVVAGGVGCVIACYFLYLPPVPVTVSYYLGWSMVFFTSLAISEIPHMSWGNELTGDYQGRARVFAVRAIFTTGGKALFYALPLLPLYATRNYTPEILHDALFIGAALTLMGLAWMGLAAPAARPVRVAQRDSVPLLLRSLFQNKPLLVYFAVYACVSLSAGMWYGLVYIYMDSFLGLGNKLAIMFLAANIAGMVSMPLWLSLIKATHKAVAWAVATALFGAQLLCALLIAPGDAWWLAFSLVVIAHLFFAGHEVAGVSLLGDIVDYGKLKFRRDRGATYFGFKILVFKVGLGIGGGLALGIAGFFGVDPTQPAQSADAILGLRLGFCIVPAVLAALGIVFILRIPIDRRRHGIILRRIESLDMRLKGPQETFRP